MEKYLIASNLVKSKINNLRKQVPHKKFNKNLPAEVEINKFYLEGKSVDRIMIVLRANGCEHYKKNGGCSMCSHYNGTMIDDIILDENYINQWNSIINGLCFEKTIKNFNIGNFPIICIYNLGSLLNPNEISLEAVKYIFSNLNKNKKIKKIIIESRAEYVNYISLSNIKEGYDGVVEVGIGVESTNYLVRELCHNKGYSELRVVKEAIDILHEFNYRALAYVNLKPCFITEKEGIDDAIQTSIDCFNMGFDAVSIEPTSLQEYALTNFLSSMGYYRVPWLWSLPKVVKGIYKGLPERKLDIRLGGYFDEEILSGSQGEGFDGKNEIFPHETSANCKKCTRDFIECIKKFNISYSISDLENIRKCEICYKIWQASYNVIDTRSIPQRIIDILGGEKIKNKMF